MTQMEYESNNFGPPSELPQPQESGVQQLPESSQGSLPETRGMQMPSTTPQKQKVDPVNIPDPQTIQPLGADPGATDQSGVQSSGLIADDTDLIEKEWVIRAKAIVLQTKDDPHTQNKEMNKVKADYLKKRYNKDLKISEG